MSKFTFSVLFSLLFSVSVFAQAGSISGIVTDANTGEALIGATVVITGTTKGTITDFEGKFSLNSLEAGTYDVTVSYISFNTVRFEEVSVGNDKPAELSVKLEPATTGIEEVQVVTRAKRESEAMLLMDQKEATVIKESIGAKQLSNMGVSDAAAATTKISGVTKTEGSGDVYIRGLGDRYLSTTMNGLPIPSDNVQKKNIDLKLFSTDVISNVGISKTYDVSKYADMSSGNVDITSKTVGKGISIGLTGGINSNVMGVFDEFKGTQNSEDVTLGYYNAPYEEGTDAVQYQSWNTVDKNFPINYGLSVLGGKEFDLNNGDKLSFFATASYSGDSEYREGEYRRFETGSGDKIFTDATDYKTKIETTGLLNLTYDFSPNSSISYNALYINKLEDELYEAGRNGKGYYFESTAGSVQTSGGDSSIYVKDQNTKTTEVFINQLLGRHKLNDKNNLKWAAAYNHVNADEPNRICNKVSLLDDGIYFVRQGGFDQKKTSQEITDNEYAAYIFDEISFIDEKDKVLKLNIGANGRYKQRDFSSNWAGVVVTETSIRGTDMDDLSEILNDQDSYDNGDFTIKKQSENTYFAQLLVYAGYADVAWAFSKFSGSAGLRYEHDYLFVEWDVTNDTPGEVEKPYNNILPAFNFKYQLTEKNAFRFAFSKTITLPEFKEIAPFPYESQEGDKYKGNEDLEMSTVYNFDIKWEIFPHRGELISAAAFYKIINDPINLTIGKGSAQVYYYENTGEQAVVYGLEIEGKLDLLRTLSEKHKLNLSFNATKMWFNQDIYEEFQYNQKTEIGLEGAAELIANLSLSYGTKSDNPFTATLTGNYSSDKIFALGGSDDTDTKDEWFNNEIIEKGFISVDFVLSKKINNRIAVKLSAKNLLDPSIERVQLIENNVGDADYESYTAVVRSYKKGRNFSIGLNINLD